MGTLMPTWPASISFWNLAADEPERVKRLRALYDAYAREMVPPKTRPKPTDWKSPKVWGEK